MTAPVTYKVTITVTYSDQPLERTITVNDPDGLVQNELELMEKYGTIDPEHVRILLEDNGQDKLGQMVEYMLLRHLCGIKEPYVPGQDRYTVQWKHEPVSTFHGFNEGVLVMDNLRLHIVSIRCEKQDNRKVGQTVCVCLNSEEEIDQARQFLDEAMEGTE